jgi:hypothetical protein
MGERRYVVGALVEPQLRLPFGYWNAGNALLSRQSLINLT